MEDPGNREHLTPANQGCWKESGTFGDRSCPELAILAHCRNCPVYSAAGRRLLGREHPEGYREEWTTLLATGREEGKGEAVSVIVFRLKQELLALKTVFFQEATEGTIPHGIPLRSGEVFKGVVNVKGELALCVDLAALLAITDNGGEDTTAGKVYPRLVVISREGQRFAFAAAEVLGVHRFLLSDLHELPSTVSRSIRALTVGIFPWQARTVGFLEEEKLFAALSRSLTP